MSVFIRSIPDYYLFLSLLTRPNHYVIWRNKIQQQQKILSRYLDLRTNEPTDPLNPSCLPLPPPTTVDASAGRKLLPNDNMVPPCSPLLDKDQSLSRTRTPHAVASLPFLFIDARSRSSFVQILKTRRQSFQLPLLPPFRQIRCKIFARRLMRVNANKSSLICPTKKAFPITSLNAVIRQDFS
jgi:hypothetical protein